MLSTDSMITGVSVIGSFLAVAGIAVLVLFWNKLIIPNELPNNLYENSLETGNSYSTDLDLTDIYDISSPIILENSPMRQTDAHYL